MSEAPALTRAKSVRPIHQFTFPPALCSGDGVAKTIGMVEITADEELMAEKRAGGERGRVAVELTKQALAQADGKAISLHDGTTDTAWNALPPKLRTLLITAYTKLHIPDDTETTGFFDSLEVKL